MSYALASPLQAAIYQQLVSDVTLSGLVGGAVFDAPPAGTPPELYVTLGTEDVRDRSDASSGGAAHDLTVSVIGEAASFVEAKTAAAAVCDALIDAPLEMSRGRLVSLAFLRARARRVEAGTVRKIDLLFRARVEDD